MTKIPVVMVHGMWGNGGCWGEFAQWFAKKDCYEVHTPTLPFHDDNEAEKVGCLGLQEYLTYLENYIRELPEKPLLIGHSMGGLLVQQLASKGLCRAAILLSSAAPRGINCVRPVMIPGVFRYFARWAFWKRPFKLSDWEARYSLFNGMDDSMQEQMIAGLVHESGLIGFQLALWFLDRQRSSQVDFTRLVCPTLLITGTMDRITPLSVVQENARRFLQEDFQMIILPNVAHWPHREGNWKSVANHCHSWIQSRMAPLRKPQRKVMKEMALPQKQYGS